MKLKINCIDKVILFGGGKLLLSISNWVRSQGMEIFVVTSPRHSKEIIENNKSFSQILSLEKTPHIVVEQIKTSEIINFLGDINNSFCLSIGASWIFKKEFINNFFNGQLFNLHGTRLPQNRGGGGFSWQILMGNRLGFCQLHLINGEIDAGDIVITNEFLYPPSCRIPKDYEKIYFDKNYNFVIEFIKEITKSAVEINTIKQTEYFSSYFPRLNTSEHGWINWSDNIIELERFICAFDDPYEGAKCILQDKIVFIKKVCVDFSDQKFHSYQNGIIFRNNKQWLSVCASGGTLIIEKVIDSKGNSILKDIKPGERFITDSSMLKSRLKKIIYTPNGIKKS